MNDTTKTAPAPEQADVTRKLRLTHRYLNLPVKNSAPMRRVSLSVGGHVVREFDIELANASPDFWVFLDVSDWHGKEATLKVDRLPASSRGLAAVTQDEQIKGAENLYREKHRPQFHFTSRRGWLNDPNGLVYDGGEYHLYYQHNPYGWKWGNMHWGHAISRDLVHWREQPIALYPHAYGDWAFSGSAVIDRENTAGFQTGKEDVLVAAYTSTGRGECIVYSNDRGRTFTEYAGNPVVKHAGRDPKVFWYAPGKHWVMAVYDEPGGDKRDIAFYTSADLKTWHYQSRVEGYYECPEFFELPVNGNPRQTKWVLYAADGAYALGAFDGKTFTPETPKLPANWGNCFYASQTYNDAPGGRRIRIGWGQVDLPGMPFNQMMTSPVELSLRTTEDGVRLFAVPVREIATLHGARHTLPAQTLTPGKHPIPEAHGDLYDIRADLEPGDAAEVSLVIRGIPINYNAQTQTLSCQGRSAPLPLVHGHLQLRVLVDRASLEIFGNDGQVYMPIGVIPKDDDHSLALQVQGGTARVCSLDVFEMRSAWK